MTPQIKQRIEQIQRGEVPEGYKKTKVGVVPSEWEITKLSSISSHVTKKNTDGNIQTTFTNSATQGVIKQTDYFDKEISNRENITGYYVVQENDYIYNPRISASAPCGPINKSHFVDEGVVSPLYTVFKMIDDLQNNQYIEYYLKSPFWHRYMCGVANYGARHDRMNITNDDLFAMPVPLPPLAEQEKIAGILSTQDKLIALKEKLIEEKKRQKKALMQQLLTGKKRLPGFSDEWKPTKLKKLLKERKTYSQKGLEYPHVTLSTDGIYAKTERYDREHLVKSEDKEYKITHKGDICYNPANLKFGAICVNTFGDAIFSPIYVTFEVQEGVDLGFLSNYLMRWDFINAVRKYEEGTVYERMAVKPEDFLKFEIMLPSIEEQKAISKVLSLYDAEIDLLRKELGQEKQKKKALMQLLLTGIVRTK